MSLKFIAYAMIGGTSVAATSFTPGAISWLALHVARYRIPEPDARARGEARRCSRVCAGKKESDGNRLFRAPGRVWRCYGRRGQQEGSPCEN